MKIRKTKEILAIILIAVAFLLATIIITNSITNSFNLVEDEHPSMMSYETYTTADNITYTHTSEDSYTVSSKQNMSNNSINSSNNNSIIESSINNSATSLLSQSTTSTNSSSSTQSCKNESVSSSTSYKASSKKETEISKTKNEETTRQVEEQIPIHEHNYMERVISPNCTSKGYTLHSCDCGKSYADNYKNALGHKWGDWETISEATITSKGLQQRICQRCSAKDYRYIEKIKVNNSPNSKFSEEVVRLINEERKKNGVSPLKIDYTLMNNAYTRSTELETNFGHKRPNGEPGYTFVLDLDYSIVGENIAAGQNTPQEVVNAWMNSTGHRSNILNSEFTNTGVGCYMASDGWVYWSQLFGG